MALVQQHLTQADWERLDREVFAKDYRPSEVPAVLGWVMSGLSPDQARRLPGANAPFLAFGRLMAALFDRRGRADLRRADHLAPGPRADRGHPGRGRLARAPQPLVGRTAGNRFRGGQVLLLTHRGRTSGRDVHHPARVRAGRGRTSSSPPPTAGSTSSRSGGSNLQADPRCSIEVRGRRIDVLATEVGRARPGAAVGRAQRQHRHLRRLPGRPPWSAAGSPWSAADAAGPPGPGDRSARRRGVGDGRGGGEPVEHVGERPRSRGRRGRGRPSGRWATRRRTAGGSRPRTAPARRRARRRRRSGAPGRAPRPA